jgi:hypothetical protein
MIADGTQSRAHVFAENRRAMSTQPDLLESWTAGFKPPSNGRFASA